MNDCRDCFHAKTRLIRPIAFKLYTIALQQCSPVSRRHWAERLKIQPKEQAGPVRCAKEQWSLKSGNDKTHVNVKAFMVMPRNKAAQNCPWFNG